MKEVKEYIKDNLLLCILFVVVIVGFSGYKIYTTIHNKILSNISYDTHEITDIESEIISYEVNEYQVITKTDEDLVNYYYNKIREMWVDNPGALYDLMTDKCKSFYDSKDDFIAYMNKFKTSLTETSTVSYYKVDNNTIVIQTNEDMQIQLTTKGINDYQITLIGKVQ